MLSQKEKLFSFENKMSGTEEIEVALLALLILKSRRRKQRNKKKSVWVKEIFRQREARGAYNQLVGELRLTDRESFFR